MKAIHEKSTSENYLGLYHVIKTGHLLIGSLCIHHDARRNAQLFKGFIQ